MKKSSDIVADIIRCFLETAPESFTEECAREIERQIRRQYGGDEYYVAREPRPSPEKKQAAVKDFCVKGLPAGEAASRNGISRRTLYRLLGGRDDK